MFSQDQAGSYMWIAVTVNQDKYVNQVLIEYCSGWSDHFILNVKVPSDKLDLLIYCTLEMHVQ